jgi:gliding motility-associated lipoprotein GldH
MSRLYLAAVLVFLLSCTEEGKIADQMTEIPNGKWTYNQIPDFSFNVGNAGKYHDFFLKLRIQKSYPYENLYLLAHIRNPEGKVATQRINFTLTDDEGKPLGKASGDYISYELPMFKDKKMDGNGQYFIALEQNMRDSVVLGVESIGVKVREGAPVF